MQQGAGRLVEHQPGQPGGGQPVDGPSLSGLGHDDDGGAGEKGGMEGILWVTGEGVGECDTDNSLITH